MKKFPKEGKIDFTKSTWRNSGAFYLGENMVKDKKEEKNKTAINQIWVDTPVRYTERKSASGVTFGGRYMEK